MRRILLPLLLGLALAGAAVAQLAEPAEPDPGRMLFRPTQAGAEDAYDLDAADLHHADSTHFRIHFTDVGPDATSLTFVKEAMAVFEAVWARQVDELGWQAPLPDQGQGGLARDGRDLVDVYLVDLDDGPYGYAAADDANPCDPCRWVFGYLVLENDYRGYSPGPSEALRSTAAHEFSHLVQMGLAWDAEPWAYEATAVWLEQATFPDDDARTVYLEDFAISPELAITDFAESSGGFDRSYGAYVWNLYLADLYGEDVIRSAWVAAGADDGHILDGYAKALARFGVSFDEAFTTFSGATTAWEVGGFPGEPGDYPTVTREGRLASGDVVVVTVDHTAVHVVDLDVGEAVTVTVRTPRSVAGGVSLTASGGGEVLQAVDATLFDGEATVSLSGIGAAGRVSLAVVNADTALAAPKLAGLDRARYLRDGVQILVGIDRDPGPPRKP